MCVGECEEKKGETRSGILAERLKERKRAGEPGEDTDRHLLAAAIPGNFARASIYRIQAPCSRPHPPQQHCVQPGRIHELYSSQTAAHIVGYRSNKHVQ